MYTQQPPPEAHSARLLQDRIGRNLAQTLPIPLAPNATIDRETILRLALDAIRIDRTVTASLELLSLNGAAPCDTDAIFYHLKKLTEENVITWFNHNNHHILHQFKARGAFRTQGWVAIDETRRPFYGVPDELTTAGQKKGGTHNAYGFLTSESLLPRRRATFAVAPRHPLEPMARPFEQVLTHTMRYVNASGFFIDRGLFGVKTLKILHKNHARYLLGAPSSSRIRGLWNAHHRDAVMTRNDLEVTEHVLVVEDHEVIQDKKNRESTTLILVHRVEDGKARINAWVTNITTDTQAAAGLVEQYRRRWGIETGYRSKTESKAFTTTKHPPARLFLYLLPYLLYNWWRLSDWGLRNRQSWRDKPELMFYVFRDLLRWCRFVAESGRFGAR